MVSGVDRVALTLSAAAVALDLSPQRVCQLLSDGVLDGPPVEGKRAKPNAPRVWEDSVRRLIEERKVGRRDRPASARSLSRMTEQAEIRLVRPPSPMTSDGRYERRLEAEARAAKEAALEMRAIAELARKALRDAETELEELHDRIARLESENRLLQTQLRRQRRESVSEKIDEAFNDALTQFLVPADPSELQP